MLMKEIEKLKEIVTKDEKVIGNLKESIKENQKKIKELEKLEKKVAELCTPKVVSGESGTQAAAAAAQN